jgi:multidrug efflux pump subunit AcrA (membrane-fusion protein)
MIRRNHFPREETKIMQKIPSFVIEVFRIIVPLLILAGGGLGFLVLAGMREAPARAKEESKLPLVETVEAVAYEKGLDIEVDGLVVPYREVKIAAEVGGRIRLKADICEAGNFVEAGTLLLEIDPLDYQLEVRRLNKELEQARVTIRELDVETANSAELIQLAEEDLELQRRELQRLKNLSGNGVITESQVDQAARAELTSRDVLLSRRSQYQLLRTRRNRFEQAQELVGTQLEKAQLDLKRTKILAPIDGVIVEEMVEQDSYIQKGSTMVSVEDTSAVEVKCNLRMNELYWLWGGHSVADGTARDEGLGRGYQVPSTPVSIIYPLNGREYVWRGVLSRFDGIGLDEKTRTVPCRIVVKEPRGVIAYDSSHSPIQTSGPPALVRGMYVKVVVHAQPETSFLLIPESAVQPGSFVWMVDGETLRKMPVRVSHLANDGALIEADAAGFAEGAKLVLSPLAAAHDGMPVEVTARSVEERPSS